MHEAFDSAGEHAAKHTSTSHSKCLSGTKSMVEEPSEELRKGRRSFKTPSVDSHTFSFASNRARAQACFSINEPRSNPTVKNSNDTLSASLSKEQVVAKQRESSKSGSLMELGGFVQGLPLQNKLFQTIATTASTKHHQRERVGAS